MDLAELKLNTLLSISHDNCCINWTLRNWNNVRSWSDGCQSCINWTLRNWNIPKCRMYLYVISINWTLRNWNNKYDSKTGNPFQSINWTLRNWNKVTKSEEKQTKHVLIGPCGIETSECGEESSFIRVLIGPCGIETTSVNPETTEVDVLIGPCGIETCFCRRSGYCTGVLIGPCGIKTCDFVFLIDCYSDTNEKDFNWLECFIFDIILYMKVTSIIYWFLKCSFIE